MSLLTPEQLVELATYERSSRQFRSAFSDYTPEERYVGLLLVLGKEEEAEKALQDLLIEGDPISKQVQLEASRDILNVGFAFTRLFTSISTSPGLFPLEEARSFIDSLVARYEESVSSIKEKQKTEP